MAKWTDDLTAEMLPEVYRPLAEALGIQSLLGLVKLYGGATLYVPKQDALLRTTRDTLIREEFNGSNSYELAKKYDLSERWVYRICADKPLSGQVTMEEMIKGEAAG